jgi:pimeloyl-ACP methyl ester carboxylesterase
VLVFPGGHTTAATPIGTDLYTDLGYRVLTFSRPGYGCTKVGALAAAEFVPAIAEVCERLRITEAAATVGVSFGGLQAVHVAVSLRYLAPRLVLHSCAPSTLPWPDTALERLAGPLAFAPRTQRLTWRVVRALTSSDKGLRLMMSSLSTLPSAEWWDTWTPADRAAARATFAEMDSGSGFVTDVRQGQANRSSYREAALRSVPCPTLVTASRNDAGVCFHHAEDFVRSSAPVSSKPTPRVTSTGSALTGELCPRPFATSSANSAPRHGVGADAGPTQKPNRFRSGCGRRAVM